MNTQNQDNNQVIQDALSQWAKLVREDANINCLQNVDHWLAMELAVLFKKLADQMPAAALALLNSESEGIKQSINITRTMAKM